MPPIPEWSVYGQVFLLLVACAVVTTGCKPRPPEPAKEALVIRGARLYTSPDARPLDAATVLVEDGRIAAVGPRDSVQPPPEVREIDAAGRVVTAGFWNSHVHLIEPHWRDAATAPAASLASHLHRMLVRHGFTSVVDAGSDWKTTHALRTRIESGEIDGPRILTAGEPLFPRHGSPPAGAFGQGAVFRPGDEVASARDAAALVRARCGQGADVIKLYLATWWQEPAARLTPAMVEAAAGEARRCGRLVLAHPADAAGIETAIAGGVDIILHTTAPAGPWPDRLVQRMREHNIAVVPTLKFWRAELLRHGVPSTTADRIQQAGVGQLRAFARAGGEVLFGTDAGYMRDDDPAEEYALMVAAGMSGRQILASLTSAPAGRFDRRARSGTIAAGEPADLVLLDGDPVDDPSAFGRVKVVIRNGRLIWDSPHNTAELDEARQ